MSKDREPKIVTIYLPMLGVTMDLLYDEAEYVLKYGIPMFPYDGRGAEDNGESP